MALGIGANTVMFTVVNGVLLKPLPYPEPERLVSMYEQVENTGRWAFAYFNFLDCQRESRTLSPMAAWRSGMGGTVSEPGEAEHVSSREISTGLFPFLESGFRMGAVLCLTKTVLAEPRWPSSVIVSGGRGLAATR